MISCSLVEVYWTFGRLYCSMLACLLAQLTLRPWHGGSTFQLNLDKFLHHITENVSFHSHHHETLKAHTVDLFFHEFSMKYWKNSHISFVSFISLYITTGESLYRFSWNFILESFTKTCHMFQFLTTILDSVYEDYLSYCLHIDLNVYWKENVKKYMNRLCTHFMPNIIFQHPVALR
jgi:hypothetical protein